MSTTIVRAFNADGYHKDILIVDEQQVRMNETRLKSARSVDGPGMAIDPKDFPEMVRFEVIVRSDKR